MRPPGVYPAEGETRAAPIAEADTRVAGFVGLAVRGPLDEPRRLSCWNDFIETYGDGSPLARGGYLAKSVEGFFLNGGECCYVVRAAPSARGDS